jgi:glycosyltransferase involved in cell wall biosynthesis
MRVVLDISTLGLGGLHRETRGGLIRVDEHLVEELAASTECELAFCANHSGLAYDGVREYLRNHPVLARYPLLGAPQAGARSFLRRGMTGAYRRARAMFPFGLPRIVRSGGQLLDRTIHRAVVDTPAGADVFHSTHVPLPPRPRGRRSPQRFLTIYDLRERRFPELYDARSTAVADAILNSVGPGDWVITSSEASRAELVAFGVAEPQQVFVVPLAADPRLFHPCSDPDVLRRVRGRYGIGDGPYILSVNSIDIRKNMHQAIRAFTRLVRQERLGDLQLVIAGSAGSGSSLLTGAVAEAAEARGRIIQAGFVDDADLAALYSGATAFLYPSFYEGFGLPPLEAMQCGTPVITSNASSLPEVVGEAGVMVPADDLDALCAAMLDLVTKPALRRSLQEKSLARAAEFSWQRTAAGVVAAYRAAVSAD